jgi:hypothetical protein
MRESDLYSGATPLEETEDGFVPEQVDDLSAIDSEVDFDDEEYSDHELISEGEAGNAEGGQDAHLDDPERVADDETY